MGGQYNSATVPVSQRTGWPMGSFFVKKLHLLRFISAASRRLTLPDGPSLGGATDGGLMADAQEAATSDSWRPVDHGVLLIMAKTCTKIARLAMKTAFLVARCLTQSGFAVPDSAIRLTDQVLIDA